MLAGSALSPKHPAAFSDSYIDVQKETPFFKSLFLDQKSTVQSCHGSTHHCAPPLHTHTHTHTPRCSHQLCHSIPLYCLYFLWCLRQQPSPPCLSELSTCPIIRDEGPTHYHFAAFGWGGPLSCNTREGACRGSKCKRCLAHHTLCAICVINRQIRIESMVKKVMSWAKKKTKK